MNELDELIDLINQAYTNNPNFLIINDENNKSKDYCVVYFSSNGIFFPNDVKTFNESITKKNIFEWYKTRIDKAQKHIFLRDVYKNWYQDGINSKLNSIEKVLNFLKEETRGYKVITVGASAGGYAAILFGILLKAKYVLSFSAQFDVTDLVPQSILKKVFLDNQSIQKKYLNLSEFIINSKSDIFYVLPAQSEQDNKQFQLVKGSKKLYTLPIESSAHGVPLDSELLRTLINKPPRKLKKIFSNKNVQQISVLTVQKKLTTLSEHIAICLLRVRKVLSFIQKVILPSFI